MNWTQPLAGNPERVRFELSQIPFFRKLGVSRAVPERSPFALFGIPLGLPASQVPRQAMAERNSTPLNPGFEGAHWRTEFLGRPAIVEIGLKDGFVSFIEAYFPQAVYQAVLQALRGQFGFEEGEYRFKWGRCMVWEYGGNADGASCSDQIRLWKERREQAEWFHKRDPGVFHPGEPLSKLELIGGWVAHASPALRQAAGSQDPDGGGES